MKREHIVSASVTNGAECICNPEILLGTKSGLWDFQNEIAPKGTLLDLNAAWELFLSRKNFNEKVSFKEEEHHLHEVIDGIVYEEGDITYTLLDDQGNETNATFTLKANKGPIEKIEWEKGKLYLYYSKSRPIADKDLENGIPIHYVYDSDGNLIINEETGKPLIYDYVSIPIIEIFDNDETQSLFPWFADEENTVRLRSSIKDDSDQLLGRFAITCDSEVFIAKETNSTDDVELYSVLSAYELLTKDLGITPEFSPVEDHTSEDGIAHSFYVSGSDLKSNLETTNKESLVSAINEDFGRTDINTKLISGKSLDKVEDWQSLLNFADYLKDNAFGESEIPNLLSALNFIQVWEIGNPNYLDGELNKRPIVSALNYILDVAKGSQDRIGFNEETLTWIALNTDKNSNLTEAINEVNDHADALADIIGVQELYDLVNNHPYYENARLHEILKLRIKPSSYNKNDIKIVEAIYELQEEIGNLDYSKSLDSTRPQLTTDNKNSVVEAINEVDLNTDNNYNVIGATYSKDSSGKYSGKITNLTTPGKNRSIVEAINNLNDVVGDLDSLNTEDKSSIVNSINEVIEELPFEYYKRSNSSIGVVLKDSNNSIGNKSLAIGENNSGYKYSFISGYGNSAFNDYNLINGYNINSKGEFDTILGNNINNNGSYNLVNGRNTAVEGSYNLVNGLDNTITDLQDSIVSGKANKVNGQSNIVLGDNNDVQQLKSVVLGGGNTLTKKRNSVIGDSNTVDGADNVVIGTNFNIEGDNNVVIGTGQYLKTDNIVLINGPFDKIHSNSTHIGKDIYIQTHDSHNKLQEITFVNLNQWCIENNSSSLNGTKFLNTSDLISALKAYLSKNYTDNALLRFLMLTDENGYIIVQGKSSRIYLNKTWYLSEDSENGWSRKEGTYLKVIPLTLTINGNSVTKYYLAIKDQLSTSDEVIVGGQRSDSDISDIDLTKAYGAVDILDFADALNLENKLNLKVDKSANIITNYYDKSGVKTEKSLNFINSNNSAISADIILDLKDSFGFDKNEYQLKSEKGKALGYVPLNSNGIIDSRYLPSYVDDVIDVWAEYQVNSDGTISNIYLYDLIEVGDSIAKGEEILEGESGKIYVEANGTKDYSVLFRWSGTKFIPTGYSNLVLGETAGTAYDGGKGKALKDSLEDHLNSGTLIQKEDGSYEVYKPNPHNVTASQLSIEINDPNNTSNINLDDPFIVNTDVDSAILELFNRINLEEDKSSSTSVLIGTPEELEKLDSLDDIEENDSPTVVGTLLSVKEEIESYSPIALPDITKSVSNYFKFYGEN